MTTARPQPAGQEKAGSGPIETSRSRVGQVETPLDTLDTHVHPIKPIGHIGILVLEIADAMLDLANFIAHVVDRATNVAQMFKHDVIRISHDVRLSYLT